MLGQRTNSERQPERGHTHTVRPAVPCQNGTVMGPHSQQANQQSSSEVPEGAGDKEENSAEESVEDICGEEKCMIAEGWQST